MAPSLLVGVKCLRVSAALVLNLPFCRGGLQSDLPCNYAGRSKESGNLLIRAAHTLWCSYGGRKTMSYSASTRGKQQQP